MDNYTEQSFENSNIIENKTNALQNSVTEKINRLAGTYKGTTRGISDGDTSPVQLEDGSRIKLREANSNGAWYDTGEVEHPGAVGLSKSAAALAPQREQAARLFGKPVEAVTQQDLYDVGNMQTIQRVADEYRSKGEPRWEAPLIKDSVRPNLDVVNAPVEVKLSGKKDMHGRDLGELINPSTGINLTQESTNDPRMNAYYGRTNREKVLSGTASYGDIKPLDLSGSTDYLSNTAVQSYNTARGFGARALDVGAKLGSLIGEGLESFGEGEQAYLDKEQKYLDKNYAGEKVSDWRKELANTIKETGTSLQKSMTEFQKSGKANKLTGYDSSDVDSLHADIDTTIKNDGYVAALGRAITDPRSLEVLVQSLPEMAALAVSVGGMAIANVNNNINIGEAELGRGFTTEEKAMSAASSIVGTYLDRLGDKLALSGMNPAKAALKTAVENAPKDVKEVLASTYGKGILAIGEVPLRLGAAGAVEGVTEYGQTLAETAAQTPKVFKEGFTDKQFDEAGVAGVLGFAMGGQIHGAMNAPSIIKEGVQALGEKYDNIVGNLDDGENGKESVGPEGRKNRWESALDVEVAPENRAVYTRDLARYAAEEFVRSGDLEGEYKDNPMKIFEDATERIAKVNQVSSEDAKDMIGRQLAKNVLDVTEQVDAKGNRAFSVDKAKGVLSKFVETIKGNKGAEDVLEKAFEDELAAKFEEVKTRLMKEGVNVDDLSNRGTLTKSELDNLEKTLESMKTLGSERLTKRAEAISNELEARQERLGSEGTDGPNVPPKKTVQEVRNEIETLGFLTRGKKSLEQHTRDLDAYVVDRTADPKDRDQALGAIENFVGSRKAKIDVVNRGKIDASGFTFRSVGELKKFAAETYADNEKIMKVVTETAAKLPEGSKERARLEKMAEHLQDTQKRMVEVQNEGGTVDEDKALLRKVGGWSTFISDAEHKAFEKYVDEYTKSRKEKVQDETETELDEPKVEEALQYAEGDKARIAAEWSELDVKGISKIMQTHSLEDLVLVFKEATTEQIEKFADAMSETYKEKFYKALGKPVTEENSSKNDELPTPEEVAKKIIKGETLDEKDLQVQRNDVEYGDNVIEKILKEEAAKQKENNETPTEKEKDVDTKSEEPTEEIKEPEVLGMKDEEPVKAETTETKEETKEEPKSKAPSKEQVDEYRKLVEEAGKELEEMEARIKAGGQIIDEAKESIKAAAEDKTKAKAVADKAKEEADKRHEEVRQLQEELKGLQGIVKDYREKMNKLYNKRKELRSQDKQITALWKEQVAKADKLNDQYYKLQETIKNMDIKTRDPKTFRRIIDELTRRFMLGIQMLKGKLNKLLERWKEADAQVKETGKVKDAVRAELQEVVDAITKAEEEFARVKEQIDESKEEVQSRLDQSVTNSKVAYDEFKRLDSTYKELSDKLDSLKESRDDKLATGPVLDMDGFYGLVDQAKGLRQAISHYKNEIARGFRAEIEEALGDVVKTNGSKRSSLTARLFNGLDVMDLMPRIIRDNEKGVEKVQKAIETLRTFEDAKRNKNGMYIPFIDISRDVKGNAVLVSLGLDKLFSDKNISEKVHKAVHVAGMVTLADMLDVRNLRGEQLDTFVEGAFGKLLDSDSTGVIKKGIVDGKFVPINTFASKAGARLLEELEIKLDVSKSQDRRDATSLLGQIVIDNLLTKDSAQTYVTKGAVTVEEDGQVLVKRKADKTSRTNDVSSVLPTRKVVFLDNMGMDLVKSIMEAGIVFEYARETSDGVISNKPVVYSEGRRGRNNDMKLTKDEVSYLNAQGSKPWKFSKAFDKLWEEVGKDVEALKEALLGKRDVIAAATHPLDFDSVMAKYDADSLDVDRMMMAYELADGKEFYIGWDYTVSNRSMMSNKMINPQNSKLSRFIIGMKDMTNEVAKEDLEMVQLGAAQAFDMDPDKKTDAKVIKEFSEKYVNIQVTDDGFKVSYPNTREGQALKALVGKKSNTLRGIRSSFGVATEHIVHVYQFVDLLRQIKNGEKLVTNLALESDGITNGMATTALQAGYNEDTKPYYIKTGVYHEGDNSLVVKDEDGNEKIVEINSHGEFKENQGKDFYETPIENFQKELEWQKMVTHEIEDAESTKLLDTVGSLVKNWRSFLKPLVMVYAYGASMFNIGMSGSRNLAIEMLKQSKNVEELVSKFEVFRQQAAVKAVMATTKPTPASIAMTKAFFVTGHLGELVKTKSYKDGKLVDDVNGKMFVDEETLGYMTTIINASIGRSLSVAFQKSFKPIDEYRKTLKAVNHLNYLISVQSFKEKANGKSLAELTDEEVLKIKDKMVEDGTYYGSMNTNGGVQDYFKVQPDKSTEGDKITVKLTSSTFSTFFGGGGVNTDINQIVQALASNVGATGVIDVHSIDGSTMIHGHIKDVLNIFDALVLGTNFKLNNEQMKEINDVYYRINMEHSILGNAVKKITSNPKNLERLMKLAEVMDINVAHQLVDDVKRIFNVPSYINFTGEQLEGIFDEVKTSLKGIDSSRRELVRKPAKIRQYYSSDAFEAGSWDGKEPSKETRYAVFANDETADNERELLGKMFKVVTDLTLKGMQYAAEESSKPNLDIMAGLQNILAEEENTTAIKENQSPYSKENLEKTQDDIACGK